jgi:hypothetical protein
MAYLYIDKNIHMIQISTCLCKLEEYGCVVFVNRWQTNKQCILYLSQSVCWVHDISLIKMTPQEKTRCVGTTRMFPPWILRRLANVSSFFNSLSNRLRITNYCLRSVSSSLLKFTRFIQGNNIAWTNLDNLIICNSSL